MKKSVKSVSKGGKFAVGERVLCYEPDLTKARVVYDAKILKIECPVQRSKNSKTPVEYHYLVHFQGWSSTWDRYVTDEFLLKTTEDNRALQKKLFTDAEEARYEVVTFRKSRKYSCHLTENLKCQKPSFRQFLQALKFNFGKCRSCEVAKISTRIIEIQSL